MPTLLPREMMCATSVVSAHIQRPSPSDHRLGFSNSFTRLRVGSLALRPALLLFGNSRPRVTTTPLPHATGAYGQLPGRDFNPLDLLLLLRTVRFGLNLRPPHLFARNQGRPVSSYLKSPLLRHYSSQACALSGTAEIRRPTAFMTAIKVFSVGLPLGERARYRLSRWMPASSATLAMP